MKSGYRWGHDLSDPKYGPFGSFTVLKRVGVEPGINGTGRYLVRCKCGNTEVRTGRELRNSVRGPVYARSRSACKTCARQARRLKYQARTKKPRWFR